MVSYVEFLAQTKIKKIGLKAQSPKKVRLKGLSYITKTNLGCDIRFSMIPNIQRKYRATQESLRYLTTFTIFSHQPESLLPQMASSPFFWMRMVSMER